VSQGAKVQNGNEHISIYGERTAKHFSTDRVCESFDYRVALDREYFSGKKVIIFDDVVTSGATAREFANELAECGAQVMGAMFLARTKRMYN
jgi:predicted amidophosphoribosyltransferase